MSGIFGDTRHFIADMALENLLDDPQQLNRERRQFGESPPPYRSSSSGTTTRSESPSQLSEEQRWLADRRFQLKLEHAASRPGNQFRCQVSAEYNRVIAAHDSRIRRVPIGVNFHTHAENNVKTRWVEQGIWGQNWERRDTTVWRWKHEEPINPGPKAHAEPRNRAAGPFPLQFEDISQVIMDEQESEEETQRREQAQAVKESEHEASRPFYQFVYQVSKEREWIQEQLRHDGSTRMDPDDINTTAYQTVRDFWTKSNIWNRNWGLLPGMAWQHEYPIDEWMEQKIEELAFPSLKSPPSPNSPVASNEIDSIQFRSIARSPAEPNQEVHPVANLGRQRPQTVDNSPGILETVRSSPTQYSSPPSPPVVKRGPGRPRRGSEKTRTNPQSQDTHIQPRRSKRLQEAGAVAAVKGPVRRRGRPKGSGTKGNNSTEANTAKESRATKRRGLKQKRTHK